MRILFLGDVFGAPGRAALAAELPKLKAAHRPDLTVANAENTSHGKGLTPAHKRALRAAGVDFFTMGNHT